MTGTCGTCTHWGKPDDETWMGARHLDELPGETDDDFEARQQADEASYRKCHGVPHASDVRTGGGPLAYTADASYYRAVLKTRAEFGCILWKAEGGEPT